MSFFYYSFQRDIDIISFFNRNWKIENTLRIFYSNRYTKVNVLEIGKINIELVNYIRFVIQDIIVFN